MPYPENELVRNYEPNSKELENLINKYESMYHQKPIHIPLYIGSKEVKTENHLPINPPHDHQHNLGKFSVGDASHVEEAIHCARKVELPSF
jgi:1-pyrroline-5-carboxylate dehydrogenase